MVGIREFYDAGGELRPGKKGTVVYGGHQYLFCSKYKPNTNLFYPCQALSVVKQYVIRSFLHLTVDF